ncbi:M16 family metallopeptidase [Vibrio fluminensis]|uniref:M16 family metallopeptidase n=1 Tax=Vibrio fluminensis TaxID=2783614 RepID=UPI0018885FD2|nr:insulinase family protein [Vibrio fluminensis]
MIKPTLISLALAVALGLTGCQTTTINPPNLAQSEQYQPLPVREDIFQYWLDNGMQVILQPRKTPGVEMRLAVHSGSLQEEEQQRGLAHFVEHMAFKGTTNFPDSQSFKALEAQGINLGSHVNAVTSYGSTVYKLSLPNSARQTTDLGLRILSDWASEISFDPQAFDREREVIVEEWRLRQGVGSRINDQLEALRYEGSRLAERNAIGTIDVIRTAPVEEAIAYYQKWYQPQRMTLVISGSFDNAAVRSQIEALFASKAKGSTPSDPIAWQQFESQPELQVATVFDPENSRRFMQLLLQNDIDTPLNTVEGQWQETLDSLWLAILNQRLAILVANGKLKAAMVAPQSHLLSTERVQYLVIAHPFKHGYDDAFQQLATELQRLASQPVSETELAFAKQQMLNKVAQQAKHRAGYSNQYLADQLVQADNYQLPMMDKEQQLQLTEAFLDSLTAHDIQQHVAKVLNNTSPKLALIGPDSDQAKVDIRQLPQQWQTIRASQPEPFNLTKPEIDLKVTPQAAGDIVAKNSQVNFGETPVYEYQLSNGMKVVVVSKSDLKGGTQINLRIPGGRSLEAANQLGIVDWAGKLAEQCGYGDYTPHQLTQWSKQHQVSVAPYSELLFHGFSVSSETDQLDDALALLHLKLTQANSCEDKLADMKQSTLQNLSKVPAERIFMDQISLQAFDNGQRLVATVDGDWNQFTAEELTQWREKLYGDPAQMITTIVTNAKPEAIEPSIKRWLASLAANPQPELKPIDRGIEPKSVTEEYTYAIGSSNKAMVQIQYSAEHPWSLQQQMQLQLLEQITNNRLRETVRVKASGVYVINMSQMLARDPAPYYLARLNFTTAPNRAHELAKLASSVVEDIQHNGITQAELDQAKKAWAVNQAQQEEYTDYWLAAFSQDSFSAQPYQAVTHSVTMINNATVESVNQLAKQLMDQNQKTFYLLPKAK